LEIRGRWEITLALRPGGLLRDLGRPLSLAAGPLGLALLVFLALGDGLGILVLHIPGTAAGDAAPLLRAGEIAIRSALAAAAALVAIVSSGAAALRAPIIVAPRARAASLALRTAGLATLTAAFGGAATTWRVAGPRCAAVVRLLVASAWARSVVGHGCQPYRRRPHHHRIRHA
jgi:hypothetical protein